MVSTHPSFQFPSDALYFCSAADIQILNFEIRISNRCGSSLKMSSYESEIATLLNERHINVTDSRLLSLLDDYCSYEGPSDGKK